MKPFSDACEENKRPILGVIRQYFSHATDILEIGSGTGQHAVFFAEQLPHLQWHCSDLPIHHQGIRLWLADYSGANIHGPVALDVRQENWPVENLEGMQSYDGIFSANTAHIMSWPEVELMFQGVGKGLKQKGYFCLYGPFNYDGSYTSDSNERFDKYLKQRDPASGLRDLRDLKQLATINNLELIHDHEMPVNNRTLVWQKL